MSKIKIAIIGSGPAALMAASQLTRKPQDLEIHVFEKRPGFGRKLLIAGSSGLNISNSLPLDVFTSHYTGGDQRQWMKQLENFGPKQWLAFIQNELKQETFLGTSDRYFVREMKASTLLKAWMDWLEAKGVQTHTKTTLSDFSPENSQIRLKFIEENEPRIFDRVIFALGGGSWEDAEPEWCELFRKKGIKVTPFEPSNVGFEVEWPKPLLDEAEGKPLKKVRLTTRRGEKLGELVITKYGLEGTPIYFVGQVGFAKLDLKPDLTREQILDRLENLKENLSPIRRVKQKLGLCDANLALLFHMTNPQDKADLKSLVEKVKALPIALTRPRPLIEAISSSGGLAFEELTEHLELKKFPHIYACGEMIDWDAPTGGFLIQGAVTQGKWVADYAV